MQIILFFALAIAALAILFTVQNTDTTTVSFIIWKTDSPLALVLLISLAAGALISFLLSLPASIRTRWTIRTQRKKISDLENSLADLRTKLEEAQKKSEEKPEPPVVEPVEPEPVVAPEPPPTSGDS